MHTQRPFSSRRQKLIIGFAAFALITSVRLAYADSLFPVKPAGLAERGSSSSSAAALFSDTRAHNVGDPLSVVISETTNAQSSAGTKAAQDDSVSFNGGAGLFQRLFKALTFSVNNSRAANGTGSTNRSGSLVTNLSVLVKEVLPNGTLRIEGSRLMGINKETQRVTFHGIVRPEDIGPDNTIASNLVADVEVRYDGKGVVGDTQRPGLLSRVFQFLF